jgi:hypothetical protein
MSDPMESSESAKRSRLADAIREVKNAAADRDDVVVDIREAQRTRLELLAEDLKPVFADVAADDDRFDFAISAGAQPRLWIDAVTHVTMGRDRRTYRFLRDARLGRVVLAESTDVKPVADQVTRYIAERVIERQRMMEGGVSVMDTAAPFAAPLAETAVGAAGFDDNRPARTGATRGLVIVLLGALVGIGVILALQWERVIGTGF